MSKKTKKVNNKEVKPTSTKKEKFDKARTELYIKAMNKVGGLVLCNCQVSHLEKENVLLIRSSTRLANQRDIIKNIIFELIDAGIAVDYELINK